VRKQDIAPEHLLVDGGSTDATLAIAKRYNDQLAAIIPGPDKGLYDAMNKGIRHASGEIIGILNSDDFYPKTSVLTDVLAVFANPQVQACYGDLCYVAANNTSQIVRYWRAGRLKSSTQFLSGWMLPHPTFFVRKSVYDRYGMFNQDLGSAADYELMLRFLLRYKITVHYIPKTLVHMRTGGVSNRSLASRFHANLMDRRAWKVNGLSPHPWTLFLKPLRKLGQWFPGRKIKS
jgi:glycosyltransferase